MQHFGIASQYQNLITQLLTDIEEREPSIPTITAIALVVFQLFVATDIKRIASEQDLVEGMNQVLAQTDIATYLDTIRG